MPRYPIQTPVTDILRGPCGDQRPLAARMLTPASTAIPVGMNQYPADNVGAVMPYGSQKSNLDGSWGPVYPNGLLAVSSALPADPQYQSQSTSTMERPESKTWCSVSQRQVLTRHVKDLHEPKNQCRFCRSFTWSQGRPYSYRNHLRAQHPQIPPPRFRKKGSRYSKESEVSITEHKAYSK